MTTPAPIPSTAPTDTLDPSTLPAVAGQALAARFPDSVTRDARAGYQGWIVEKDKLVEVATALRDDFDFDLLSHVTGVDYFPDNIEVSYNVYNPTPAPSPPSQIQ